MIRNVDRAECRCAETAYAGTDARMFAVRLRYNEAPQEFGIPSEPRL